MLQRTGNDLSVGGSSFDDPSSLFRTGTTERHPVRVDMPSDLLGAHDERLLQMGAPVVIEGAVELRPAVDHPLDEPSRFPELPSVARHRA
jgi:hypothetical protein